MSAIWCLPQANPSSIAIAAPGTHLASSWRKWPQPTATTWSISRNSAADEGYRSLYSGIDLSGWRQEGTGHFTTADWQIAAGGPGRSPKGMLVSAASFRSLDFFIDWKCGGPGENEQPEPKDVTTDAFVDLTIAGHWDDRLRLSCSERAEGQAEGTGWNRTRVRKRDANVEVELNGRALTTKAAPTDVVPTVPLTITHEGGVMTLANLFVRERP